MRLAALSIVAAFFLCLTPAVAQDDSPAALRKQIDQLTEQIAELEATIARSTERIERLTDENRRYRDENKKLRDANKNNDDTNNGPNDSPKTGDTPSSAEIPSDPFASPDSLLLSLEESWNAEFEGVDVSDKNQSRQYLRNVRRWATQVERDSRGTFSWRVKVLSADGDSKSNTSVIQVLDDRDMPIGEPAEVEAKGAPAHTILQAATTDAVLEVSGNQDVDIDIDARLGDSDDQLGPYLEHTINYTVTSARYE